MHMRHLNQGLHTCTRQVKAGLHSTMHQITTQ